MRVITIYKAFTCLIHCNQSFFLTSQALLGADRFAGITDHVKQTHLPLVLPDYSKRLGVDIKFLELDEVDASLDKACTETYTNVIKTLQKDFKVFVITHNDALKDKFNKAILVEGDEKNGAVSKLVDSW